VKGDSACIYDMQWGG